jgi:membrane fusion protein (multidrug efflux system)
MRAEIDMDSEGGVLRPGMYATVRLRLEADSGGLTLPASVILRESENAFVWTVEEGTLMKTPVEIASDDGNRVVIKAGLDSKTRVVIEGPQSLRAGQAVRVEEQGAMR